MTDRDDLTALFDRLGIEWEAGDVQYDVPASWVHVYRYGPKNDGYSGFYAQFMFDEDGAFQKVGVWE